ncbi:MAG: alpha/beta hydrolase [Eubacteriales bacterium]|nr:alpha/beta hydrolase [Eubacteriales bacterium]
MVAPFLWFLFIVFAMTALYAFVLAYIATVRKLPFGKAPEEPVEQTAAVEREIQWFRSMNPEPVEIVSRDGLRLRGRLLKAQGSDTAVLLMHGYRCPTGEKDFAPLLKFYYENHITLLVIDQRAHGESEGKRICFGVKERYDCAEWLRWLNSTVKPKHLLLHGLSMGAATVLMATRLQLPDNLRFLIADCGYTSPWEICKKVLTSFHTLISPSIYLADCMVGVLSGFRLKDASAWEDMQLNRTLPVLFIHGEKDGFVPVEMSKRNYQACAAPKELLLIPNAEHGQSAWVDTKKVEDAILCFYQKYAVEQSREEDSPLQDAYE